MLAFYKPIVLRMTGRASRLIVTFLITITALLWVTMHSSIATPNTDEKIEAANQLITKMIIDVEKILAEDTNDLAARTGKVASLFDLYFDLPTIARFSVGRYWRVATTSEKAAYQKVMREVIVGTVARNFGQLSGLKFTTLGSKAKGNQLVLVDGVFTSNDKSRPTVSVAWRVLTRDIASPRILDVEIENISMVVTQRQENVSIIRQNKGKFSPLIDAMQQRSAVQN
jgi:phospholipid transport system substrate-binding protein